MFFLKSELKIISYKLWLIDFKYKLWNFYNEFIDNMFIVILK